VFLFGRRLRPASVVAAARTAVDTEQERLELVVRLAALDERFAAGEIGHAAYGAERDRGKERLRELLLSRREAAV
jgi:hypothetical protein